jgi:site-specific DNA recombinase
VVNNLKANLQDPHWISAALEPYSATPEELRAAFIAAEQHLAALQGTTDQVRQRLLGLVVTICISGATVRIEIRPEALLRDSPRLRGERGLCLTVEARLRRFASANKIVLPGRPRADRFAAPALVKAIARGHVWFEELARGEVLTVAQIATREGVTDRYVSCLLKLAFLAPQIVDSFVNAQMSLPLSTKRLTLDLDLPRAWHVQQMILGIADF